MLGGTEPVIIFEFFTLVKSSVSGTIAGIPLADTGESLVPQEKIPFYLSEERTGILIDAEDKNIDIETDFESLSNGKQAKVTQKAVSSNVTINLIAKKDRIGLSILASSIDFIFDKVTSKEYSISYLNGPLTIFRSRLQSFQVNQTSENDKVSIQMVLTVGEKAAVAPVKIQQVNKTTGTIVL